MDGLTLRAPSTRRSPARLEHAAIDELNCACSRALNRGDDVGNILPDQGPVYGRHDQDRVRPAFQALLCGHVFVPGEKYVKALALDECEQGSVGDATPRHADNEDVAEKVRRTTAPLRSRLIK